MSKTQNQLIAPERSGQSTAPPSDPGTPPPITGADIPDLIAGLQAGAVDPLGVHQRIIETVRGGRLWGTPEWKELRQRLIKDACEQCRTDEGPMTLQHLWHPAVFTGIARHLHQVDRQAPHRRRSTRGIGSDARVRAEPAGTRTPSDRVCRARPTTRRGHHGVDLAERAVHYHILNDGTRAENPFTEKLEVTDTIASTLL
ncbi:MAG: hypothetical protein JWL61_2325 [Gemmatimonadetes bacterium]|nr:hypothetical protein [Gemmatimonadota bacterium]